MTDDDLLRYSRHILLDEIGIEGQGRLLAAHALVIGAGGLGSPVALYLGTAGVGRITLVDHDTVDLTNLQRQIAHTLARVGQPKVESARAGMLAINPTLDIRTVAQRADAAWLDAAVAEADLVLDCSDNFATRHQVNAACVKHRKPLVSGAVDVHRRRRGRDHRRPRPQQAAEPAETRRPVIVGHTVPAAPRLHDARRRQGQHVRPAARPRSSPQSPS